MAAAIHPSVARLLTTALLREAPLFVHFDESGMRPEIDAARLMRDHRALAGCNCAELMPELLCGLESLDRADRLLRAAEANALGWTVVRLRAEVAGPRRACAHRL